MKQIVCVWFPFWPIQRRLRVQQELKRQLVVVHSALSHRSPRVVIGNRRALRQGVQAGMPLAEARSLVPRAHFLEHDAEGDREQLRELAEECQRFTPRAGLEEGDEPDCLFLDVTGCDHLFGDLRGLCHQISRHFRERGYWVRGVCSPTWGASLGLARHAASAITKRDRTTEPQFEIVTPSELPSRVAMLPVAALRLATDTLSMLAECGLRTVGQLLELPRSSLPSRFGSALLLRLDQALGTVEELLTPEVPPEPILVRQKWEYPIHDAAVMDSILRDQLERVFVELQQRQRVTQELRVTWRTETGEPEPLVIRLLKPTQSTDRLAELLSLRQERFPVSGGVTSIEMELIPSLREAARRTTLFEQADTQDTEFAHLIERLSQRLGEEAVLRSRLVPEAQPELATTREPWLPRGVTAQFKTAARHSVRRINPSRDGEPTSVLKGRSELFLATRPLRLLPSPERLTICRPGAPSLDCFRWRGREYRVASLSWPERIVTGWWRERSVHRDYYRIETEDGARFWVYQDLENHHWSLHGVYE